MITFKQLREKVINHRDISPVLKPVVHKPFELDLLKHSGCVHNKKEGNNDRPDYGYEYGPDITSKPQKPTRIHKTNQNPKTDITFGVDFDQDGDIDDIKKKK